MYPWNRYWKGQHSEVLRTPRRLDAGDSYGCAFRVCRRKWIHLAILIVLDVSLIYGCLTDL
jgi:hypothetical protein